MGLGHSSVVRGPQEDKTYDIYLACGRVQGEGLRCGDNGKLGLGQRSRMTHEESRGKAYVEGQREAGTRVYRLRKEARSRMTKESRGRLTFVGQREAGTQCIDLEWMVVVRGTLDELPPDGFEERFLRNLRIYNTCIHIVLS